MSTQADSKTVGDHITEAISESGMTKKSISEKTGIPYSSLNAMLKGWRSPTIDMIFRIAEVIGKKPSELIAPSRNGNQDD